MKKLASKAAIVFATLAVIFVGGRKAVRAIRSDLEDVSENRKRRDYTS
jgi:hypothetical protein